MRIEVATPSPLRNGSREAFPFVEAPAKTKLTGGIETHLGDHLAALSTFRVGDIPIMAARNKDVRRKRVVFGFHCRKFAFDIAYCRGQLFQCFLKASHIDVHPHISAPKVKRSAKWIGNCNLCRGNLLY